MRSRGELMILPAGVTKGTGLREALGDLGLSPHNTIGVGDGENDHSLMDVCEIGVAVANAVDAIRAHADVTLALADGQGVADLLRGPLLAGRTHVHPRRWQLTLGVDEAHGSFGRTGAALGVFNPAAKGYLVVTWQPEELSGDVAAALDAVIALRSPRPSDHLVELTAAVAGMSRAEIARLLEGPTGRAVLAWRAHAHHAVAFTPGVRSTRHVRHEHKYDHAGVEPGHRFYFRIGTTPLPGRSPPTCPSSKPSSGAVSGACCATTAPPTTSLAGSPASSTTSRSPSSSPPPKPNSPTTAPPRSSNRSALR